MIYLIIYLIGFVATWILCKIMRLKEEGQDDWIDIKISFIISLFSVFGFIILLWLLISEYFKTIKLPKPPKWL